MGEDRFLLRNLGTSRNNRKSILLNCKFAKNWLSMSLSSSDCCWLVDHYYTDYLYSKAKFHEAKVSFCSLFAELHPLCHLN